jgi:hypothetical protein
VICICPASIKAFLELAAATLSDAAAAHLIPRSVLQGLATAVAASVLIYARAPIRNWLTCELQNFHLSKARVEGA